MPYTVDAGGSVAPRRNKDKQKNSGIIKSVAERRTPLMDVVDSWEAGKQDWTDDFAAKFKARCGYGCSEPFGKDAVVHDVSRLCSVDEVVGC